MAVRKLRGSRVGTVYSDTFLAERGTIFYDDVIGEIRIGDGVTPGGLRLKLPVASNVALGGILVGSDFNITANGTMSIANSITNGVNLEIDGGNAFTVYTAEIEVDGGGA